MAVVKNMMVRVGADFSSLTTQSKKAATATKSWAAKTTASFQQVGAGSAGLTAAAGRMNRFASAMSGLGSKLLSFFALRQVVNFAQSAIEAASDLAEVQNVVDVVFGGMSDSVDQFAADAKDAFGLSQTMAKQYVGTFGAMASSIGFGTQAAYEMSTALTGLVGDVASFYNLDQEEAYTKLKSVFTGETEALKEIGVMMTQANLDAYALANGYGKTTSAMSALEQTSLRFTFVQDALSNASGDYARTFDGWANQVRTLKLNFEELKVVIGQGLIALLTPFLRGLNTVLSALVKFGNAVSSVFSAVFGSKKAAISGAVIESVEDYSTGLDGLGSSASGAAAAAKELKRQVMGFDEITKLPEQSSGGSGGGGTSGGTVSGGAAGAGGSVLDEAVEQTTRFSAAMQKFHDFLAGLNFEPLKKAWDALSDAAGRFGDIVCGALDWGLVNVLEPLSKWTIEEGLPAALDTLSAGLDAVSSMCWALQPAWQWVWDNVLSPLASAAGDMFTHALGALTEELENISGMFTDIGEFLRGEKSFSELLQDWLDFQDETFRITVSLTFKLGKDVGKWWDGVLDALFGTDKFSSDDPLWSMEALFGKLSDWWDDLELENNPLWSISAFFEQISSGFDGPKPTCNVSAAWGDLDQDIRGLWKDLVKAWGKKKVDLQNKWENLKSSLSERWKELKSGWGAKIVGIKNAWTSLTSDLAARWNELKSSWGTKVLGIRNAWSNLVSDLAARWNELKSGWGTRSVGIRNAWTSLTSDLSARWNELKSGWGSKSLSVSSVWRSIGTHVSQMWNSLTSTWGSRKVSVSGTWTSNAASIVSSLWNAFQANWGNRTVSIDAKAGKKISVSSLVNKDSTATLKLSKGSSSIASLKLAFAARGGIVRRASLLGNTIVGEAGQEAIVPLENNTEWIDLVAARLNRQMNSRGAGNGGQPLIVQVVLDGRIVGQTAVNYINENTKTGGTSPLLI